MGLFSFKKQLSEAVSNSVAAAPKSNLPPEKESLYEAMVQNLLKESKTSMGMMGKSSTKAAVQLLRPNEIPKYAILTNVSLGSLSAGDTFTSKGFKNKTNGVLIITDERLLFAGALGTPVEKVIPLEEICVIDDSNVTSVILSVLRVEDSETILAIDGNKQVLNAFCEELKKAVRKRKPYA